MRKTWFGALALAATLVAAAPAQAQVFTPTFTSPRLINDLGVYLSDGPGNLAVEGIWRGGPLGLRAGFVEAATNKLSLGAELRNPLPVAGAPLGLAFTAGAQGVFGDGSAVGLQTGLSAGYTFAPPGAAFTPYIHPRVALVNDLGPGDDLELKLLADVGIDVEFWNSLVLRFGVNFADVGSNWGIGLAFRR
jgi:hypothetical protein